MPPPELRRTIGTRSAAHASTFTSSASGRKRPDTTIGAGGVPERQEVVGRAGLDGVEQGPVARQVVVIAGEVG